MRSFSYGKIWFTLSVAFLGVAYGIMANQWGWFPSPLARSAWEQAELVFAPEPHPNLLEERVYERSGTDLRQPERMQPGLTLVTSWWEGKKRARLIDRKGRVVHEWRLRGTKLFPDQPKVGSDPTLRVLHGSYLFPNGDLLVNVEYTGTVRVDACGKVRWRMPAGSHHSIARAEDGTFWIPAVSESGKEFPGLGTVTARDQILQVTGQGTVLDRINVLSLLYSNGLWHRVTRLFASAKTFSSSPKKRGGKLTHLNDVEPLPSSIADEYPLFEAGDLLVSLRNLHLVFVFDSDSEQIKWHTTASFVRQHDPDFMGEGWIGVFDNNQDFTNRGTVLGGSRIVAVQPSTDSTTVRFPTSRSDSFYTPLRGKWQRLDNGNLLLTEAQAGRVVEVDSNGQTVWEWIREPRGNSVPAVTEASRYDLSSSRIASWPCSSIDTPESGGEY